MKNISVFLSENFQFLEVKFSIYLNRRFFVMGSKFFHVRVGPFSEGFWYAGKQTGSHKSFVVVFFRVKSGEKFSRCLKSPQAAWQCTIL